MSDIDLYEYDKWLKKNYGEQTCRDYMSKMENLKRGGIKENSPPVEILDKVEELCEDSKGTSTARMYEYAILSYQNFINDTRGERIHMIDHFAKARYEERYKRSQGINPPKKGLLLYKMAVGRCTDEGIKLALMVQLNSGLRIGEVLILKPEDITMRPNTNGEDTIWLKVAPNKTSYGRTIKILREDGLFDADDIYQLMAKHINESREWPSRSKMFTFLSNLDKQSEDPGGNSHDLRKYCSRGLYRAERLRGKNKRDASETVRRQLGHINKGFTVGETRDNGGYIGKVYLEDKGGKYRDEQIDWRTP